MYGGSVPATNGTANGGGWAYSGGGRISVGRKGGAPGGGTFKFGGGTL